MRLSPAHRAHFRSASTCFPSTTPMDITITRTHTEAVIRAFFSPERQDRYLGLSQSQRGREKLCRSLAHLRALDPRYTHPVPRDALDASAVARLLRQYGAPETCYVLAENQAIDDRIFPLQEALSAVVGRGSGAILSCLPGELAYYEGEGMHDRYVLRRKL